MQEEKKNKKSFHQGMKAELKKVIWPTGKQVAKNTFATIGFVLLISIILVALNTVFSYINTKWFDLVIPGEEEQQNEQIIVGSGDDVSSGEEMISGDVLNTEATSGENDVDNANVDSGDENSVTE